MTRSTYVMQKHILKKLQNQTLIQYAWLLCRQCDKSQQARSLRIHRRSWPVSEWAAADTSVIVVLAEEPGELEDDPGLRELQNSHSAGCQNIMSYSASNKEWLMLNLDEDRCLESIPKSSVDRKPKEPKISTEAERFGIEDWDIGGHFQVDNSNSQPLPKPATQLSLSALKSFKQDVPFIQTFTQDTLHHSSFQCEIPHLSSAWHKQFIAQIDSNSKLACDCFQK